MKTTMRIRPSRSKLFRACLLEHAVAGLDIQRRGPEVTKRQLLQCLAMLRTAREMLQ